MYQQPLKVDLREQRENQCRTGESHGMRKESRGLTCQNVDSSLQSLCSMTGLEQEKATGKPICGRWALGMGKRSAIDPKTILPCRAAISISLRLVLECRRNGPLIALAVTVIITFLERELEEIDVRDSRIITAAIGVF